MRMVAVCCRTLLVEKYEGNSRRGVVVERLLDFWIWAKLNSSLGKDDGWLPGKSSYPMPPSRETSQGGSDIEG